MDWGKHPASMMEHPHQRELKTEAKAYDVTASLSATSSHWTRRCRIRCQHLC